MNGPLCFQECIVSAAKSAQEWRPVLAGADCCATIVVSLEEAVRDPHFVGRGLFAHEVTGRGGSAIAALPLPIDPAFRDGRIQKGAPRLDEE